MVLGQPFIAIGMRHYDIKRASRSYSRCGQWTNGMLPHIVFSNNSEYYATDGDSSRSPYAPTNIKTSGITLSRPCWLKRSANW